MTNEKKCVAITRVANGKWFYYAVAVYAVGKSAAGLEVWKKHDVIIEATTVKKIERLADEYAAEYRLPVFPSVRHHSPVTEEQLAQYAAKEVAA
jgi:hypothetical protein